MGTETSDGSVTPPAAGARALGQSVDSACSSAGARDCGPGNPSRQPLLCEGGVWRPQELCNEGQRCDAEAGASQGTCVMIAKACIGRAPDEEFCDGTSVRICSQGISSVISRCGNDERCVEHEDSVACDCGAGTVKQTNGACQVANSCDVEGGGCDELTQCTMEGGTRVCGPCPTGYVGDGDKMGCSPVLLGLDLSAGATSPELGPSELAYRVQLPLIRQQISLTPRVAEGVEIEINGDRVANGAPWNTGLLNLGEHTIALLLKGRSGLNTMYEIAVERAGAEVARLESPAPEPEDNFGYVVAIQGDTLVVGAVGEDSAASGVNGDHTNNDVIDSGAVFVFVRASGTDGASGRWVQQAYLKGSAPQRGEFFGGSAAIDGDTLLIGATRDDGAYLTDATGTPERAGAVYVFQRTGTQWAQAAVIESPSATSDLFGYKLAMSERTVVIAAPNDAADGDASGAVYTLERAAGWGALQKLRCPEPRRNGTFGWSLALSGDSLIVGAPESTYTPQSSGAAFAFVRSTAGWEHTQKLEVAGLPAGAGFGHSVALYGDKAAIGAPSPGFPHAPTASTIRTLPRGQVYLFDRSAGQWQSRSTLEATIPRPEDYFGISLAMSDETLLVGASGDSSSAAGVNADPNQGSYVQAGAFYLYALADLSRPTYVKSSRPSTGALVGEISAMSGDTIIVGATHEDSHIGAAYVFR